MALLFVQAVEGVVCRVVFTLGRLMRQAGRLAMVSGTLQPHPAHCETACGVELQAIC